MGDGVSSGRAEQKCAPRAAMLVHSTYPWDERVKREAEALAAHGYTVDVVCLQENPDEPLRDEVGGVSVHRLPMRRTRSHGKLSYVSEFAGSLVRSFLTLSKLNSEHRYDAVQVHTLPDFLVFAALPAKLTGAKVILDIHDLMPELYVSKYGLATSSPAVRTLRIIERASIAFSDHVITASEAFRDRLVTSGVSEDKVTVVLNTADPSVFPAPPQPITPGGGDRFTVIWHGTMVRRYGVDLALRGCALVRDRIPGLRFVIYGEGEEEEVLRALSRDLGLDDVVEFRGHLPHTELATHLAEADLGVVSNVPDVHIDMAYPTKLFEFVQMRLPVVATRTPVLERRFGERAITFCDASPEGLADGMLWVYSHPDLAVERSREASAICDSISWERTAAAYANCVDRTLARTP